jgi:hypothetical protein
MTPDSAPVAVDGGPRIHGVVDVIRPDRVAGWAIDRADPAAHVEVRLEREGRAVATAPADRLRKDLAKGGVGTGLYGFALPLDPPLEAGMEFTLTVIARTRDGQETRLRAPKAEAARPENRLLERVFAEIGEVRKTLAALDDRLAGTAPETLRALEKVEVLQTRLEAAISGLEPPAAASQAGLRALAATALGIAAVSLALGLVSLWGP